MTHSRIFSGEPDPTDLIQFGWTNSFPVGSLHGVSGYIIALPGAAISPPSVPQEINVEDRDLRMIYVEELSTIQRLSREILGADTVIDVSVADSDSPEARIVVHIGYQQKADSVEAVMRLYRAVAENTSRSRLQHIVLMPEPVSADGSE